VHTWLIIVLAPLAITIVGLIWLFRSPMMRNSDSVSATGSADVQSASPAMTALPAEPTESAPEPRVHARDLKPPSRLLVVPNRWLPGEEVASPRPDRYPGYGAGRYGGRWGYIGEDGYFVPDQALGAFAAKGEVITPASGSYVVPFSTPSWQPMDDPCASIRCTITAATANPPDSGAQAGDVDEVDVQS
jgi:hypothetical protein